MASFPTNSVATILWLLLAGCSTQGSAGVRGAPAIANTQRVDLDSSGVGYPVYRIPALTVSNAGTLIAAYDGRPSMADVPGNIALLVRRSVDGGATWLPRQVARSGGPPLGYGDPSLLVDRTTGRIFLFHVASVRQGFTGSARGNREDDLDVLQADYSWSDDDGRTWQHRRITSAIKDPSWGGMFASSGQGIQLRHGPHAGRLIQQYVVRRNGANYGVSAFSDDHGATWRSGQLVGPGLDENKTVELDDGRVMLNSRATPHRLIAFSADGGETWGEVRADSQLIDPANNGAIVRYDPDARPGSTRARWLVFSNTAHAAAREHVALRYSCDNGTSWSAPSTVEAGRSAYSTIVILPGGDIGVLFERGNYEFITFARVSPRWPGACQ
ncbi:MAG: exo-alpha-sialidase [Gemmatimonadaceae bacterium]|nr:exo-alpha-sialidase [Gemmatimonadaceae bacterium]